MVISSIHIIRPKNRDIPILAYADISIDTGLLLRDIQLRRGTSEDMPFMLRMPVQRSKNGTTHNPFHPINKEARSLLTEAVVDAFKQAESKGVNECMVSFDTAPTAPQFSQFRIRKFPGFQQLKGFASCVLDDAIALNSIAIVQDSDTKMLRALPPTHYVARVDSYVSYFRFPPDEFNRLYHELMEEYSKADLNA